MAFSTAYGCAQLKIALSGGIYSFSFFENKFTACLCQRKELVKIQRPVSIAVRDREQFADALQGIASERRGQCIAFLGHARTPLFATDSAVSVLVQLIEQSFELGYACIITHGCAQLNIAKTHASGGGDRFSAHFCQCVMAELTVRSLYSRYMLCVPDRESYLNQTPKFLILRGFFSLISSTETISPVVFLNFLNCLRKYQNLDLATIWSVAKILILYRGVTGSDSVGIFRPITRYSFKVPLAFIFSCRSESSNKSLVILYRGVTG